MKRNDNNNVRINLDLTSAALDSAVDDLVKTQFELADVKAELAQAEEKLARLDKIRESDFDFLVGQYAYYVWAANEACKDDNEHGYSAYYQAKMAIRDVIGVMYNRDVCEYKAPNPDHLLIEVRECETLDCKPIMYIHWDASGPLSSFDSKVFVK